MSDPESPPEHDPTGGPPAEADAAGEALRRLEGALRLLEAAVARRLEADVDPDDVEAERAIMAEDRARLAAALDAASARLAEVEAAAETVGHRLERAIGTVETVLARPET